MFFISGCLGVETASLWACSLTSFASLACVDFADSLRSISTDFRGPKNDRRFDRTDVDLATVGIVVSPVSVLGCTALVGRFPLVLLASFLGTALIASAASALNSTSTGDNGGNASASD